MMDISPTFKSWGPTWWAASRIWASWDSASMRLVFAATTCSCKPLIPPRRDCDISLSWVSASSYCSTLFMKCCNLTLVMLCDVISVERSWARARRSDLLLGRGGVFALKGICCWVSCGDAMYFWFIAIILMVVLSIKSNHSYLGFWELLYHF